MKITIHELSLIFTNFNKFTVSRVTTVVLDYQTHYYDFVLLATWTNGHKIAICAKSFLGEYTSTTYVWESLTTCLRNFSHYTLDMCMSN